MHFHRDIVWFAKAAATAALVLALCAFVSKVDRTLPLPTTATTGGEYEQALDRYARDPNAQIVLVGSSLTVRLREEFFSHTGLRNLAIGGGSLFSGLAIVASYPRLPPLVLVEANILSRSANPELLQKYSNNSATTRAAFSRPIRLAAAHYQLWLSGPRNEDQEQARISTLLREAPADYSNAAAIDRQLQSDNNGPSVEEFRHHAAELSRVVASLADRGTKVYFYRLPFQGALNHSRYAEDARTVMHQAFPEPGRWLDLDYPLEQLRWADGVHLDERSAAVVAQSMDRAIAGLEGPRPGGLERTPDDFSPPSLLSR
jgi:hypothetical protein